MSIFPYFYFSTNILFDFPSSSGFIFLYVVKKTMIRKFSFLLRKNNKYSVHHSSHMAVRTRAENGRVVVSKTSLSYSSVLAY